MTPTPHLRFVKRYVPAPEYGSRMVTEVRVLQQWWDLSDQDVHCPDETSVSGYRGEWRDVPVEEESK